MNILSIQSYIGLAGVSSSEEKWKQTFGYTFEWITLFIAFFLPIEWYLERHQFISFTAVVVIDWAIWGFFVIGFLLLIALVRYKSYYLVTNWMIMVIIVYLFPLFWIYAPEYGSVRALRLLMALILAIPWGIDVGHQLLMKNQIWATFVVFLVLVFLSGLFMTTFDSGIHDPFEGAWWAFETLSTVGYGDIVPTTWGGKIFASFVMVSGVFISALLTAHIASYFLGKRSIENRERIEKNYNLMIKALEQSHENFQTLNQKLIKLQEKLDSWDSEKK
jgi:voltage-gated potassium channel